MSEEAPIQETVQVPEQLIHSGRPMKLTKEIIAEYARILPLCQFLDSVSDHLGIDRKTIHNWLRRGRLEMERMVKQETDLCLKSELLCLELFHVHKRAMAEGEIRNNVFICNAAEIGMWQAAAWLLERRYPEKYGSQNALVRHLQRAVEERDRKLDETTKKLSESTDKLDEALAVIQSLTEAAKREH